MANLNDFLPEPAQLLDLPVEDLAVAVLRWLRAIEECEGQGILLLHNQTNPHEHSLREYAGGQMDDVTHVLAEVWCYLRRRDLLASKPFSGGQDREFITRRGLALLANADSERFICSELLNVDSLDDQLAGEVVTPFVKGKLDLAVREAFRRVELSVRDRSGLGDSIKSAQSLMTSAFRPTKADKMQVPGPLTDDSAEEGEQRGTMQIFAGVMGRFRNPHTHRDVGLDDPQETVELIHFANLLLRMIDRVSSPRAESDVEP